MTASTASTVPSVPHALEFIRQVGLPEAPALEGELQAPDDAYLDPAKDQAAAVGADIVSFMHGLEPERRRAIAQALLLAQLVANKRTPDRDSLDDWYQAYFDVLQNLGWVIENRQFTLHEASGRGLEAHEAILAVAAAVLGAAPAALAVVKATLDALKGLGSDHGWIALFNRDQQSARAARFQMTLAADDQAAGCTLQMMAFTLEADASLTQVAFFKVRLTDARLRNLSTAITIDASMLAQLQPVIQERVAAFQAEYIRTLPAL